MKNYALTYVDLASVVTGAAVRAKAPIYGALIQPTASDASLEDARLPMDAGYYSGRWAVASLIINHHSMAEPIVMDQVSVKVTMSKVIVSTKVQGLDGSIKEHISNGDMDIVITGSIVATGPMGEVIDEYPEQGVRDLIEMAGIKDALQVGGYFTDLFGISKIVVNKFGITQSTHLNSQEFVIDAVSDMEYVIKEEKY